MFSYPPCSLCMFYVSFAEHGKNFDDDDADDVDDAVDDDDVFVQEQRW